MSSYVPPHRRAAARAWPSVPKCPACEHPLEGGGRCPECERREERRRRRCHLCTGREFGFGYGGRTEKCPGCENYACYSHRHVCRCRDYGKCYACVPDHVPLVPAAEPGEPGERGGAAGEGASAFGPGPSAEAAAPRRNPPEPSAPPSPRAPAPKP